MAEITIRSPKEMETFGAKMATEIPQGSVIFLNGDMGSGKTTFVQAFAKALAIEEAVRSPTFIIQTEYNFGENRRLNHLDLYRLENMQELTELNLKQLRNPKSYTFIEWADKFDKELENLFRGSPIYKFNFEIVSENERLVIYSTL